MVHSHYSSASVSFSLSSFSTNPFISYGSKIIRMYLGCQKLINCIHACLQFYQWQEKVDSGQFQLKYLSMFVFLLMKWKVRTQFFRMFLSVLDALQRFWFCSFNSPVFVFYGFSWAPRESDLHLLVVFYFISLAKKSTQFFLFFF